MRPAVRLLLALAALALVAAACGDDGEDVDAGGTPVDPAPTALPDRAAEYVGELTSVTPFVPITEDCIDPADAGDLPADGPVSSEDPPFCTDPDAAPLGSVLVEEVPGVQEGEKISLRVDQGTALFRGAPGEAEPVTFDDLREGDVVAAWVDGPVADSYPQQGAAAAILVTG